MSVWALSLGVILLVVAALDAAVTTVSAGTAGGPLTPRLGRLWWRIAHRLARHPRSVLITSAGPVILVGTVVIWLSLLWAGWTLIFSADPSAVVSARTQEPVGWAGRAYFAGFTTFTLGVGDHVPVGAPWKLLTVVATISGLALTTVAITYFVPVVTAATDRSRQASMIAGLGGQAHRIVTNAYADGSVRWLESALWQLTDSLLLTAERHLAYPILHYFHPRTPRADLRVQLAALDDALTLVTHGLDSRVEKPHPAAVSGARAAIDQLLERANVSSAPAPPLDLQPLRDAGVPTVDDDTFATRLDQLEEHRRRLASYEGESRWNVER